MYDDNLSGSTLGQYQLRELVGRGGMAVVYRAYQEALRREVAVKVVSFAVNQQPGYAERFVREAQTAALLEHSHIVPIYDYGTQNGISYIVMRLLTGGSLTQRLTQREAAGQPLPTPFEVAVMIEQIASALQYAHNQNVIHRDMKTSNIMFDRQGTPYVVDFGIARLSEVTMSLTTTGVVVGTPAYMAPEQWRGDPLTPAADQYALAIVAYQLLSGRLPYEAPSTYAMMHKHLNETPPSLNALASHVPVEVDDVLLKALAKDASARYARVTDFSAALRGAVKQATQTTTTFFTFPVTVEAPSFPRTPTPGSGTRSRSQVRAASQSRPLDSLAVIRRRTQTLRSHPVLSIGGAATLILLIAVAVLVLNNRSLPDSGAGGSSTPNALIDDLTETPTIPVVAIRSTDTPTLAAESALTDEPTAPPGAGVTREATSETIPPGDTPTTGAALLPETESSSTPNTAEPSARTETPEPTLTPSPLPTDALTPTASRTPSPTETFTPTLTPSPTPGLADLAVTSISGEQTLQLAAGDQPVTSTIVVVLVNRGERASGAFDYEILRYPDSDIFAQGRIDSIAPGESYSLELPITFTTAGDFVLYAQVDVAEAVAETNESNNLAVFSLTVQPAPTPTFTPTPSRTPSPTIDAAPLTQAAQATLNARATADARATANAEATADAATAAAQATAVARAMATLNFRATARAQATADAATAVQATQAAQATVLARVLTAEQAVINMQQAVAATATAVIENINATATQAARDIAATHSAEQATATQVAVNITATGVAVATQAAATRSAIDATATQMAAATPTICELFDTNGDARIDVFDIRRVAAVIGSLSPDDLAAYDFDGDGDIDVFDLRRIASQYGQGCGS